MDILPSEEISAPVERKLSVEVLPVTYNDIEALARVQWFARKKGVESGYLPPHVLGLHIGEDPSTLTEKQGILYAGGEIKRFFYQVPGMTSVMFGAWSDNMIIGKGALEIEKELQRVTLHSLEVLPEFQGKGVARTLRDKSIQFVRNKFPSIEAVRFGRYRMSSEFTQRNYMSGSFFNALRQRAQVTEDTDNGVSFEWLTVPIALYEEEVRNQISGIVNSNP